MVEAPIQVQIAADGVVGGLVMIELLETLTAQGVLSREAARDLVARAKVRAARFGGVDIGHEIDRMLDELLARYG